MKISYNRLLYVQVHCAVIKYTNGKVEGGHYLVQLVDLDDHR